MILRFRALVVRTLTFMGGVAIIYHEVWLATDAQILLVILGLWLCGVPIADFLDKLRKLATLQGELIKEEPPTPDVEVDAGGHASLDRRSK